ncbi:MAG: hypothetical protein LOD92_06120 [Bacillales bacterium]
MIEIKVKAGDIRYSFGKIVDVVVEKAFDMVEGWTHYDVRNHERDMGGVEVWELALQNQDLVGDAETVADVYIRYYGHDDDTPDDAVVADAIIEVDSNAQKRVRVKKAFIELADADTDFSIAADMFIRWCVEEEFRTESFQAFVEWISDEQIDDMWEFFFGYSSDFEKFAADWVDESEVEDYLGFARTAAN